MRSTDCGERGERAVPRKRREEPLPLSIAGRLEHLISTAHGSRPLDTQQIAAMTQQLGHPLTASYIAQLRRGSRTNPTIDSLRVLAAVFDVPVSFFFPSNEELRASDAGAELVGQHQAAADQALIEAMKNEGVRDIALRSSELDPAGRRVVAAMLRELRDVQISRHEPTPPPDQGEVE